MLDDVEIRFVRNKGWAFNVVAWRGGISMPFTPTHAEYRTKRGTCIGQHGNAGGMREYCTGYDGHDIYLMPNGSPCETVVRLPCTQDQASHFDAFMREAVKRHEPYDWSAAWGFLLGGHHHKKFASMCSAKVFLGLRAAGIIRWPVTKPAHEIDPATLMLMLSVLVEVSHDLKAA